MYEPKPSAKDSRMAPSNHTRHNSAYVSQTVMAQKTNMLRFEIAR